MPLETHHCHRCLMSGNCQSGYAVGGEGLDRSCCSRCLSLVTHRAYASVGRRRRRWKTLPMMLLDTLVNGDYLKYYDLLEWSFLIKFNRLFNQTRWWISWISFHSSTSTSQISSLHYCIHRYMSYIPTLPTHSCGALNLFVINAPNQLRQYKQSQNNTLLKPISQRHTT